MRGLWYSHATNSLRLIDLDVPPLQENEVLVKVRRAGICTHDIEILNGFIPGFDGILGHELVGVVTAVGLHVGQEWVGKRVCADIHVSCEQCDFCIASTNRGVRLNHCPNRRCLGIRDMNGCFSNYVRLPAENLYPVPDNSVNDAVLCFVEPLAACLRPLEQGLLPSSASVAIVGDGKLGWLMAEVLVLRLRLLGTPEAKIAERVALFGRHPERSFVGQPILSIEENLLEYHPTSFGCRFFNTRSSSIHGALISHFDAVVEVSSSSAGIALAFQLVKPQGTVVLKTMITTTAFRPEDFRVLEVIVAKEVAVFGSKCGSTEDAVALVSGGALPHYLTEGRPINTDVLKTLNFEKYISKVFPLSESIAAIEEANKKGILKVQIECD